MTARCGSPTSASCRRSCACAGTTCRCGVRKARRRCDRVQRPTWSDPFPACLSSRRSLGEPRASDAFTNPAKDEIGNDGEQTRHHQCFDGIELIDSELVDDIHADTQKHDACCGDEPLPQPPASQGGIAAVCPEERGMTVPSIIDAVRQSCKQRHDGLQEESERHRPVETSKEVAPKAMVNIRREAMEIDAEHQKDSGQHDHHPGHHALQGGRRGAAHGPSAILSSLGATLSLTTVELASAREADAKSPAKE